MSGGCWRRSWRRKWDEMETGYEIRGISGQALLRAANAMLRSLGGQGNPPIFPMNALPNETATELGAVDPGVENVAIAPVVVRNLATDNSGPRRRVEFLIPGAAITEQVTTHNIGSAMALLDSALGLVYQGEIYRIEGMTGEQFAGTTYLYRVTASY